MKMLKRVPWSFWCLMAAVFGLLLTFMVTQAAKAQMPMFNALCVTEEDAMVWTMMGEQKSPAKTTRSHSARLNSSTAKRTLST